MVTVYRKAALSCVGAYRTVCVLADFLHSKIVADEWKRPYCATKKLPSKSRELLWAKRDIRQSTLCIWEERFSRNQITGEWTRLLIRNQPQGQLDFWLTQVMGGHGVFNKYLHQMSILTSPEYSNCDIRGRDDDAWHTLFQYPVFNDIREDVQ